MELTAVLDGCLDAGDYRTAAACVLAHPVSRTLTPVSVEKLFGIAFSEAPLGHCDRLMIEIAADAIAGIERLA